MVGAGDRPRTRGSGSRVHPPGAHPHPGEGAATEKAARGSRVGRGHRPLGQSVRARLPRAAALASASPGDTCLAPGSGTVRDALSTHPRERRAPCPLPTGPRATANPWEGLSSHSQQLAKPTGSEFLGQGGKQNEAVSCFRGNVLVPWGPQAVAPGPSSVPLCPLPHPGLP